MIASVIEHLMWTSGLVLVICCIIRFTRPSPWTCYLLWSLAIVKLLLAPLVCWPHSAADLVSRLNPTPGPLIEQVAVDRPRRSDTRHTSEIPAISVITNQAQQTVTHSQQTGSHERPSVTTSLIALACGIAWIVGSLVLLGRFIQHLVQLHRLKAIASPPGAELLDAARRCARRMNIKSPKIYVVPQLHSPVVFWLGRTILFWPAPNRSIARGQLEENPNSLSLDQQELILTHEFAHVRRCDHLLGYLEVFANIVWWWFPITRLIVSRLDQACENCCDADVLSAYPQRRRMYAELLLTLAEQPHRRDARGAFVWGVSSTVRSLRERISLLINPRIPRHRLPPLLAVLLVSCLVVPHLGLTNPPRSLQAALWSLPPTDTQDPANEVTQSSTTNVSNGVVVRAQEDANPVRDHMEYLLRDGGRWRADNPTYEPDSTAPTHFLYEFTWGPNQRFVKGQIKSRGKDGKTTIHSELVVFWHPESHEMTIHHYGSEGNVGRGTSTLDKDGNEHLSLEFVTVEGDNSAYRYFNERLSPDSFRTHRKEKSATGWKEIPTLTWKRIK